MEAAAAFLLLLIVIFVAIVGGAVWLVASTLRRRKLSAREDKIDRHMLGADERSLGASANGDAPHAAPLEEDQEQERPEHTRVTGEQQSRSMPRR